MRDFKLRRRFNKFVKNGGGGGAGGGFVITFEKTGDWQYTSDKTSGELYDAINSGSAVMGIEIKYDRRVTCGIFATLNEDGQYVEEVQLSGNTGAGAPITAGSREATTWGIQD